MSQHVVPQWACSGPILPSSDLRIGRRLGLQVFQLDVEWPRLQPKGRTYRWDPANFESYDRCVDQLLEQEFEPQICLSDGELPGSLKRDGGWASRDTAKRFVDYADGLSRRLSDRVGRWLTLRDLSGIASRAKVGWNESLQPPMSYLQSIHHLLMAHAWAADVIDDNVHRPLVEVELRCPEPHSRADRDEEASHHRWILDPLAAQGYPEEGLHDRRDQGILTSLNPAFVERGDLQRIGRAKGGIRLVIEHPWDEERYHELEAALQRVGDRPLSLHLRQNYGDHFERHPAQDEYRSKVLLAQLESIVEAHASSINVQSIQLGPLLDEQEWSDGASPRKGLVWVDPKTDQRWPKSSALVIQRLLVEGTFDGGGLQH